MDRLAEGVFGAKFHWYQLGPFLDGIRLASGGLARLPAWEVMERLFPGLHYVRLRRGDTLRQAISYHKRSKTRTWWRIDGVTDERSLADRTPEFDLDEIDRLERLIVNHDARWDEFFGDREIEPLQLRRTSPWSRTPRRPSTRCSTSSGSPDPPGWSSRRPG